MYILVNITFCRADLDLILFCKLLGVCATVDNGDASIIDASVNPKSGPQGICQLHEVLINFVYICILGEFVRIYNELKDSQWNGNWKCSYVH